jgi:hypothetical protein
MDALQFNCSWNGTCDRSFLKPQQNLITSKQILINSSISNALYSNLGYKSFYWSAISPNMPNCASIQLIGHRSNNLDHYCPENAKSACKNPMAIPILSSSLLKTPRQLTG